MYEGDQTEESTSGRRGGVVVALRNTNTAVTVSLTQGPKRWVLGSDPTCDIHIVDPFVSHVHCVIERKSDGALMVRDADSRNGTFIDGNPVEGAELRVGAYMSVGRTTLIAMASEKPGSGGDRTPAIQLIRGHHPLIRSAIEQGIRAAQSDCSVLLLGETGTGKDLMARMIHEASHRVNGPYVAVNCGAIPRDLIASELFGHEKGSFTGAHDDRDGYFMQAHGGTLFLDEIGELPMEMQPHLLRALETRKVRRVGGAAERAVNVRIIAATNQLDCISSLEGVPSKLRLDLYHRVATFVMMLPPLRERITDLPEIVEHAMAEYAPEFGTKRVTEEAWIALSKHHWPGNIRELRHAVARAMTLGGEELIPADFFSDFHFMQARNAFGAPPAAASVSLEGGGGDGDSPTTVDQLVPYQAMLRGAMELALDQYGSIRLAAASLGMPKSTFADRAKQWGLLKKNRIRVGRSRPRTHREPAR